MPDTEPVELECDVCGATESETGTPFTAKGQVTRHISKTHPDEWARRAEAEAVTKQTRQKAAKKPSGPAKTVVRADLTQGLTANLAGMGMLYGARRPYRGQVLVSFTPKLAEDLNASAQAGPEWWYQGLAMIALGGVHMVVVFDLLALVIAFRAETDEKAGPLAESMRAMGMPIPPPPTAARTDPARPAPGPVVVEPEPPHPTPEAAAPTPDGVRPEPREPENPVEERFDLPARHPADMAAVLSSIPVDLSALAGHVSEDDLAEAAAKVAEMFNQR